MEVIAKLNEEFCEKLKLIVGEEEESVKNGVESSPGTGGDDGDRGEEEDDEGNDASEEDADEDGETDDEEEEFSFVFLNPDGTLITAEEAFKDGQIRTSFPLFDQDRLFGDTVGVVSGHGDGDLHAETETAVSLRPPLRKVFAEDRRGVGVGETSGTSAAGRTVVEISTAPDTCKKSHSTGFSKLWRFRDLLHRSNSDGRDAFVFLKNHHAVDANPSLEKTLKEKKGKHKTAPSSSAEKHFKRSKATREAGKKKSYLPYKQVGLFTNVNELSRNIHPL